MNKQELENGLTNFYGTENYYSHPLASRMLCTDGVRFFAENAGGGAHWWLDIVATEVFPLLQVEPFIVTSLVAQDNKAYLFATDGNDNVIWERKIDFTDCPDGEWKFFLVDNVLMIPSEY